MSKGLEELKRMAYENACCRCQYYIDKKCTNNGECVWETIEKELKVLDIIGKRFGSFILTVIEDDLRTSKEERELLKEVLTKEELENEKIPTK